MTITNRRMTKQFVFVNENLFDLLEEIPEYFRKYFHLELEKHLDDLVITYQPDSSQYIATVYLLSDNTND